MMETFLEEDSDGFIGEFARCTRKKLCKFFVNFPQKLKKREYIATYCEVIMISKVDIAQKENINNLYIVVEIYKILLNILANIWNDNTTLSRRWFSILKKSINELFTTTKQSHKIISMEKKHLQNPTWCSLKALTGSKLVQG